MVALRAAAGIACSLTRGGPFFHQFTLWLIQITGELINGKGSNALFTFPESMS